MALDSGLDSALLEKTIGRIVDEYRTQGKLHEITPRLVRARVEDELQVSSECTKAHKQTIKEIALRFVNDEQPKTVETEDRDEEEDEDDTKPASSKPKSETAATKKRKRAAQEFKSKETIEDSDAETPQVPAKAVKKKKAIDKAQDNAKDSPVSVKEEQSGTDPEILVNDQEKPQKGKKRDKAPAKARGKKTAPSKDEDSVKRLKSFVLACGVRKVWSKEFSGIEDQPHLQERKLREILKSLGMEGRLSIEKAKQIKEKRDMEKELADVQAFHDKVTKGTRRGQANSVDSAQEDEEEEIVPTKRKAKNARQSIMAFLGDQSSDDE